MSAFSIHPEPLHFAFALFKYFVGSQGPRLNLFFLFFLSMVACVIHYSIAKC